MPGVPPNRIRTAATPAKSGAGWSEKPGPTKIGAGANLNWTTTGSGSMSMTIMKPKS